MRNLSFVIVFFLVVGCNNRKVRYEYPKTINVIELESYFSKSYVNNFSNLEDFRNDSIKKWFKLQDSISEDYFTTSGYKNLLKRHDSLESKPSDLARQIRRSESGQTFFLWKDSIVERKILQVEDLEKNRKILFDPIEYADGLYEIEYFKPSYNGRYIALAMGKEENFSNEILIFDTKQKSLVGSKIVNTKPEAAGGIKWSQDSKKILFIQYPEENMKKGNTNRGKAAQYNVERDRLEVIFENGYSGINYNEQYYPVSKISSQKSNYVFIYLGNASDYWDSYYTTKEDYETGNFNWKPLYKVEDSVYHDWGNERHHNYFYKRLNKGNIELCKIDLRNPDFKNPQVLASGDENTQLSGFETTKDKNYFTLTTNGIKTELFQVLDSGIIEKVELPISAGEITFDFRSPYHEDIWFTIAGWTANPKEYFYKNGQFEFETLGMWPNYPQFSDIISEVIEVESHDGVKVPMSIVRNKNFKPNGKAIGLITAYGAYGISETPWFHAPLADFISKGNIYVSAHVRGGGEKGPEWHKAGFKSTKENSWKDLIACSEYLIEKGYIHPEKLGLNVNSAGGITGGMAVNERPELFGSFVGFIPTLNPIRTGVIEGYDDSDMEFEFGDTTDKESFVNLLKMDPLVNLVSGKSYPSTLMILGFNDYLVPPSAPGKYIASLQSFTPSSEKPYLLDVKFDAEHEIDWLEDYTKMLYFTVNELERRD